MAEEPSPYDKLEQIATRLATRGHYAESNRASLLAVHAALGLMVSFLLAIDGPSLYVESLLSGYPLLLAAFNLTPAVGGFLLAGGLLLRRAAVLELAGMVVLFVWNVVVAATVIFSSHHAATDGSPLTKAVTYPIGVYLGLSALMAVHIVTIMSVWRGRRDRA